MLREAGYTSVASTMEPRGVFALHRKHAYDLILLDLQMPGMDGFQVIEGLKTNVADGYLPVLVITAQPGHKLRALQAGVRDFISKPFDLLEVKTRIRNMLEVRLLYRKLENANWCWKQAVQERTAELRESEARYRSLTELASDWYWEQDENGTSPRFPARSWKCSESASALAEMRRHAVTAGTRRSARRCRQPSPRGSHSSISSSAASTRRLAAEVPGERRADVQPVLPLHRLPRNRRRTHRKK
jgi:CheY-like chemotaxis protein